MSKKIPRGDENLICRYHKKPMSEVCHTCDNWTHVRGKNPNTGEEIDDWKCSDSWVPILLMGIMQKINQNGAAVESFRNEMVSQGVVALNMAAGISRGYTGPGQSHQIRNGGELKEIAYDVVDGNDS